MPNEIRYARDILRKIILKNKEKEVRDISDHNAHLAPEGERGEGFSRKLSDDRAVLR